MNSKELEFAVFCIENLSLKLNKNASDVYKTLKNSRILDDYIIPLYDVLHAQDMPAS